MSYLQYRLITVAPLNVLFQDYQAHLRSNCVVSQEVCGQLYLTLILDLGEHVKSAQYLSSRPTVVVFLIVLT